MPVDPDNQFAGGATAMVKWAGQPAEGGLGGSTSTPDNRVYDAQKKPGPFMEIGISGLAEYGGFVREEFLPALQGDNARKVYREMYDNDPIIGAVVFAIQMLLRKVEWRVEPPEAASVEEIVQERFEERQQAVQEQQQAQQSRLMEQQAGLAATGQQGNARGAGPGGKPAAPQPPQMGRSALAGGAGQPIGFHQPITPRPAGAAASGSGVTPPAQPGANAPLPTNTNAPAAPDVEGASPANSPGTNPGGGPAQAAALEGNFGTGTEPKADAKKPRPTSSDSFSKSLRRMLRRDRVAKAGGSGGGGGKDDGIDVDSIGMQPIDPSTGQPMEFPVGAGLSDLTPAARHAEELAVFIETCLHDMSDSWADTLSQIVTMIVFGFAFHEVIYKKRNGPNPDMPSQGSRFADGRIGLANLAGRAQETLFRWEFDDAGNILGFWQLAPPKFQLRYIPLSKAALFRTTAYKNNPEGRSIFRSAYRPWHFKKRIEEYEAIGVERDLAGLPMGKVPYEMMTEGATPAEQATVRAFQKMIRNVRSNEQAGILIPSLIDPESKVEQFSFELLSGSGTARSFDTDKIITRYEQRMAMTALADVLLLGHEGVGSQSLGETKKDLFTTALEGWLDGIADVINTSIVPRLMQINGEDPAMSPKLAHGKLESVSLADLGAIITALSGAGADLFPDTPTEDAIREKAGLPPKASSQDL